MNNFAIVSATCEMTGLKDSNYQKCSKFAELVVNVSDEVENVPIEEKVLLHYLRLKSAEAMNEARILSDSRKYEDAKQKLTTMRAIIANSAIKNDPVMISILKDVDEAIKNVNPEVYMNQGRHHMMENVYSHHNQFSNINSNYCVQNQMQGAMLMNKKKK
jgi:hypothetical protein